MRHTRGHLRCRDAMRRNFPTCRWDAPIGEVARDFGGEECPVVVIDANAHALGILAPRELESALLSASDEPSGKVASTEWMSCTPDEDARLLGARLLASGQRVALVLERGRPIGLVTISALGHALHRSRHSHRLPRRRRVPM